MPAINGKADALRIQGVLNDWESLYNHFAMFKMLGNEKTVIDN